MAVKAIYVELMEEQLAPCIKEKLEKDLKAAQDELLLLKTKLSECQANVNLDDNDENTSYLKNRIQELEGQVNDLNEQLENNQNLTNAAQDNLVVCQKNAAKLEEQLNLAKSDKARLENELNECRNKAPSVADWRFSEVVVMQNSEVVTAVVTIADANLENPSSDIRVPNYFWVNGGGATLDVLSVKTVGSSTTALIQLNSNHGKRTVSDGAEIEISVTDGPRSSFRLSRVVGADDKNAVYKAVELH